MLHTCTSWCGEQIGILGMTISQLQHTVCNMLKLPICLEGSITRGVNFFQSTLYLFLLMLTPLSRHMYILCAYLTFYYSGSK